MDEDDKKHLISTLRATVASQKGGVELQALNCELTLFIFLGFYFDYLLIS
jgi:hypothetical protein